RDPYSGEPVTAGKPFQKWLRGALPKELLDIYHSPTPNPFPAEDQPPTDPERWGVWADAHPILRDWRELVRAARVAALPADLKAVQARYEVVPHFRSVSPALPALRRIAESPVFRAQEGHVFLVGTLEDLKTRCLTWLCRQSKLVFHGTLRCRYFAGSRE